MNLNEKVKFVRKKLFLTQEQLAKEIGVSYITIHRWETGSFTPHLHVIGKFETFCEKNRIIFKEINDHE